jgi:hypothetical protein
MKAAASGLLLLVVAAICDAVTPVDRVISLLTKLNAQVQAEGTNEAASYDKYACFCKDHADNKVYEIAKSDHIIAEFDAEITKLASMMTELDDAVAKNKEEIAKEEKTQKEKAEVRAEELKEYTKKREDLAGAIDAVEEALAALHASKDDVEKTLSLLLQKVQSKSISAPVLALIAQRHAKEPGDPAAYEYQSKEIISTLQSLEVTFKKELAELDESEILQRSNYEMAAGARANSITALKKENEEKETMSASMGEEKSNAEDLKEKETIARNADQAFLDDLTAKCEAKAKAWDQRSTSRAAELTAINEGITLLKGMGDAYNANSKLVGLVQKGSQRSFLQLRSVSRRRVPEAQFQRLTERLRERADTLQSAPLLTLALQLKMSGDHFVKVRGLIKDLIAKLEEQAAAEATAKSICDKNMKAALEKRDDTAANAEIAGGKIDSTTGAIHTLKEEIADLEKEIATLNAQVAEMTELRKQEKADNEKTLADAAEGKTAVDEAITVLKNYYDSALIQRDEPKKLIEDREGKTVSDLAPETFSSTEEYKGKQSESKGIIGILEVIASDFDRTIKTVGDAEIQSEKDYQELKTDTEKSISDKEKLKKTKRSDLETKESELTELKADRKLAQEMHAQALEELDKMKSSCVDSGETWEERSKHRKEEIEALKEALAILEEWKS